ncbi:MAG: SRPBCC family protein [Bacteroidota bacterium]
MKLYTLQQKLFVPVSLEKAWDFFSDPENLAIITPPEMKFVTTSAPQHDMYPGQIISYTLSPLLFFRIRWVTEITHVVDKQFFVDEQRFGPYKFWHHQHKFKEVPGGIEMTDLVHFGLPFGILAAPMVPYIRKKVAGIFTYREKVIKEIFP